MKRIESGMRIVIEFVKDFNNHNIEGMTQFITDNCILETIESGPNGTKYVGKREITKYWEDFFRNSRNTKLEIEEIFGSAIRCVLLWSLIWDDLEGNRRYLRGVDIYRVKNGLIEAKQSYAKT